MVLRVLSRNIGSDRRLSGVAMVAFAGQGLAVAVERGLLATQGLPPMDRCVDVFRVQLDAAANPPGEFRSEGSTNPKNGSYTSSARFRWAIMALTSGRLTTSGLTTNSIRASGPGGQNVNKVSTAVQLRSDAGQSPSLPDDVRQRLLALAGNRATQHSELIITSRVYRTQEANRAEARARLNEPIARAQAVPKARRPSRPTLGSKFRRPTAKSQRSSSKKLRGRTNDD
jgi:ribosome-associated protein